MTRLGNFTQNVANLKVQIDNNITYTIARNTSTPYFEVASGKRKVLVTDAANGTVIYNKEIEFISYEESSVYFGGYFSPDILLNTFSPFYIAEGDTYVLEQPKADNSFVYFVDMLGDLPQIANNPAVPAKKLQINAVVTPAGKADTTIGFTKTAALEFGKITGAYSPAGKIKVAVVNDANSADTLAQYNGDIAAGTRYFFYLNLKGNDVKINIAPDIQALLPVRQK